jgi:hypothetical protein
MIGIPRSVHYSQSSMESMSSRLLPGLQCSLSASKCPDQIASGTYTHQSRPSASCLLLPIYAH